MQEKAASITEPAAVRKDQLDLQRAALKALLELGPEVAEPENARIEKEYASTRGRLGQFYGRLLDALEQAARREHDSRSQKLQEQIGQSREYYQAQQEALDAEYARRRQRAIDEAEAAHRDARKKMEQDLWLADSVADATREQIQREREKVEQSAPVLNRRLDEVKERADWVLKQFRYRPPEADGVPEAELKPDDDPARAVERYYEQSLGQLEQLERLSVPHLVIGLTPVVLAAVLSAALVAAAAALSFWGASLSFQWLGPLGGAVGIAVSLVGYRGLSKLAQSQMQAVAGPLEQTLNRGRQAVEQHLRAQREQLDRREVQALQKRASEIRRAESECEQQTAELDQRRVTALQRLEEIYLKAKAEFEQQRDSQVRHLQEEGDRALHDLRQDYDRRVSRLSARRDRQVDLVDRRHAGIRSRLEEQWRVGLDRVQEMVEQAARLERLAPPWDDAAWREWSPSGRFIPAIRFGRWRIDLAQIAACVRQRTGLNAALAARGPVAIPAVLELPERCSLLMQTAQKGGRDMAIAALQATMTRLLTSLPAGRVQFTIVDPVGLGENFAGFMHLADYDEALVTGRIWTEKEHIEQRLGDLTGHMENVIQKYLRNEFESIDAYNVQAGELAEPYRFLVIADFPANFTEESIHRLTSIVASGARCGVYTLIAHDTRLPLPPGYQLEDLQLGSVHVRDRDGQFVWEDEVLGRFGLSLDAPPEQELLTELMHKVGQGAGRAKRVEVPFEFVTPPPDQLWAGDSRAEVRVPVGRTGAVRLQELRLGRGVAQHALIAGKTGSGKSTLLHVLITNLVLWYPPDEVEFYLIDFKKGVEFKTYATHELPHARAIAIESDREFGLSVLHRLDEEMERRGEMFRHAGVQDLPSYRQATQRKLPRTLLVVDEFQVFFSEDDKIAQDAAILLDRLVRQGRAFGIHVILGSQTLGGTSGLPRSTIGQMAVRIALQCSEIDSQLILDDGNSAARLLSRPGEAIYNDAGGLLQGNSPFQTAWLSDEKRDVFLDRAADLVRERRVIAEPVIVFEGNAPADLARNRILAELVASYSIAGGESPALGPSATRRFWLGEAVAIKDPTAAILRRQSGANVLLIGQRDDASLAIMVAGMIGLAAQHRPDTAEFVILDGSSPDSPEVFRRAASVLPHRSRHVEYRAVSEVLAELTEELHRRQEQGTPGDRSVYILIYGLQRYRMFRKSEDAFSFSYGSSEESSPPAPDRQLAELLREGPSVGIHVIAWADTPATVERTFDRQTLREFDNRILFQMSAADSSNLIDSPIANRLGFYRALLFSEEQGLTEKFRPYRLPERVYLDELQRLFGKS